MTDLRDALRALKSTPVVTAVAVLSLALGIGANTAIFSLVNALMLRDLPVREPDRLVQVMLTTTRASFTNPLWEQMRDRGPQIFDGTFAYSHQHFNLARGGETQLVWGVIASGAYFDVLGVRPVLGRTFSPANDIRTGDGTEARQVAVIGYGFWQRHYGGAADVLGKAVELDRVPYTIIGVADPAFTGVDHGTVDEVFIPLAAEPLMRGPAESAMDQRSWWWLRVMARLKPGDTLERATAALRGVQPQIREATIPPNYRAQTLANYLKEPMVMRPAAGGPNGLGRQYRAPLYLIMVVVALVLLIACANIANLLLARAAARRHELSVRIALGASRWRIARQLLAESALLSGAGTILGLLFAQWGARLLVAEMSGQEVAAAVDVGIDWRVLSFTIALAGATTFLFGIVPALRSTRVSPSDAIKEQGRSIVGESRFGLGSWLVAAQVALSLVLIASAGLFLRTFSTLTSVRLGFEPDPLVIVDASARRSRVAKPERAALFERLRAAAEGVPGVRSAALQTITPLTNSSWDTIIQNPEGLSLPERERDVHVNEVSPGFFATWGTPILAGRDFTTRDTVDAPRVVVVNETFAKKYFSGANPVGRFVRYEPAPGENQAPLEIVGLVRDAVYESLRDEIPPTMYQAAMQNRTPGPGMYITARAATGSPALLTRSIADALSRVDPDVTLTFTPYRKIVREATVQERVIAMLSAFFGGLALLLAALGLYGVMSYAVSRRRTEIGIRMALGAGPAGAVRLILLRAAVLVGLGVVAGTAVALWAAKFMAGSPLIYGVQPRDPMTIAAAATVLMIVGATAGYLPARRASRIDPARVLREG